MKKIFLIGIVSMMLVSTVLALTIPGFFKQSFSVPKHTIDLCYKEAPDWTCIEDGEPTGILNYKQIGEGELEVKLLAKDLDPEYVYQLTLNGNGLEIDNTDTKLSEMSSDPWISGLWGDEGWYNFEMTEETEEKTTKGKWKWEKVRKCYNRRHGRKRCYYRWKKVHVPGETTDVIDQTYEIELPKGVYEDVKFLVKRTTGAEGHGGDFKAVLMETEPMSFVIV